MNKLLVFNFEFMNNFRIHLNNSKMVILTKTFDLRILLLFTIRLVALSWSTLKCRLYAQNFYATYVILNKNNKK